jgi:hypothetical protein
VVAPKRALLGEANTKLNNANKKLTGIRSKAGAFTRPFSAQPEPCLVTEAASSVHFSAVPETFL